MIVRITAPDELPQKAARACDKDPSRGGHEMRPSACGAHHAGQGCADEPLAIAPPPRTDRRLADPPRASVSRGGFLIHIRAVLHSPERSKVPGKIQRQDRELTNIGTPSGDSPRQGCDSAAGPDRNPSFFPSRSRQELFRASVASGGGVPRSQEDIPDEDAHSAPPGLVADFGATVRMAPTAQEVAGAGGTGAPAARRAGPLGPPGRDSCRTWSPPPHNPGTAIFAAPSRRARPDW